VRTAVFDSNVLVAGCGWRAESYLCLLGMARRRARVFTSDWILEETRRALTFLQSDGTIRKHDPWPAFHWFASTARIVAAASTGKQRSRDADDDPILGAALAAQAAFIVTQDSDLLVLEKPFGIEMVRPRAFLARLQRPI
jgi:predicted nucleic acid-binding protein